MSEDGGIRPISSNTLEQPPNVLHNHQGVGGPFIHHFLLILVATKPPSATEGLRPSVRPVLAAGLWPSRGGGRSRAGDTPTPICTPRALRSGFWPWLP